MIALEAYPGLAGRAPRLIIEGPSRWNPFPFRKMHGLGNDFVVFDARERALDLSVDQVRAIADRHTGVGCDQLIIMEPPRNADADVFMRIRNADGSEVEACGNATRCVASVVMKERGADHRRPSKPSSACCTPPTAATG